MRPGARLRRKAGFGKRLAPPVGPVSWQLVSCWQTLAPHSAGGLHRPSLCPGTASLPVKLPGNRREGFSARGSVQQARGAGSASAQSLPWNCVFLPVKLPGNRKGLFCSGLCPAGLRTIWGALYGHPFAPGLVEQLPNLRQQPLILLPGQRPAVEQPPGAALGLP